MSSRQSEPMSIIRVSIVEDNANERQLFADLVNKSAGLRCASVHPSLEEACRSLAAHRPDVVLLDLRFDGEGAAWTALPELKAALPQAQFLMLTRFDDDRDVFQCLKAGAFGYWLKSEPLAKVIEAIRDIHAGGASMSSVIARKVLTEFNKPAGNPEVLAALSPRERQILESMAVGHRYKEMAGKLGISYDTVRAHIRRIYEKLHVHSRGEAVAKYHQTGGTGTRRQ